MRQYDQYSWQNFPASYLGYDILKRVKGARNVIIIIFVRDASNVIIAGNTNSKVENL